MKMIRVTLGVLFALTTLSLATYASAGILAAGQAHTCVWDGRADAAPACFGDDTHGETVVPPITGIRQMEAGAWHTCALHRPTNGHAMVTCWGNSLFKQTPAPEIEDEAVSLSVGRWHNCAVYARKDGTRYGRCWGRDQFGQVSGTPAVEPSALFAGTDFSCGIFSGAELRCWGSVNTRGELADFPNVRSPEGFACESLAANRVNCWSNVRSGDAPSIRVVRQISASPVRNAGVCEITGQSVRCDKVSVSVPASVGRIQDVAVGDFHACVIGDQGFHCAGSNSAGQSIPPVSVLTALSFGPRLLDMNDLAGFLTTTSEFVYSHDEKLLRDAATLVRESPEVAPLVFFATRLALVESGYTYVRDAYLAQGFANGVVVLQRNGLSSLRDVLRTEASMNAAWRLIGSALQTGRGFVAEEDLGLLTRLVRVTADHIGDSSPASAAELAELQEFFARWQDNPYVGSRALMTMSLLGWIQRAASR